MKLITPQVWAERHFDPECRPAEITIMRLLRDGKLPGRKVGGKWFIDEQAWLAGDDDLLNRILAG